jgi:lipoprotein-releasing system ATP-binding protein
MSDTFPTPSSYGSHGLNLSDMPPLARPSSLRVPHVPFASPRSTLVPSGAPLAGHPLGPVLPDDDVVLTELPPWSTPQTVSQLLAPNNSHSHELVSAHFVRKSYRRGSIIVPVLQGVELSVNEGEFVSIIGPSGCGKTTLLHLLATLDRPDSGEICFEGHRIDFLPTAGRDILRNRYFGMVFQFYHLLPELNVLENVLTPAMIGQGIFGYLMNRRANHHRAKEMLELVGLGHRLKHKPRELSGGEMQRTAIARALVARPRVLLADEPTGNLDKHTGEEIMQLLRRLNREQNLTIVMVTHDSTIAAQADRTVTLVDGRVVAA